MSNPLIRRLKEIPPKELEQIYTRVFDGDEEGRLVLEDLKGRFFEYTPANNMTDVGAENVLKHIKNMINPPEEEEHVPAQ